MKTILILILSFFSLTIAMSQEQIIAPFYTTPAAVGGGGSLSGSYSAGAKTITLSTEGTTDWGHWGANSADSYNDETMHDYKSGATITIGTVTLVGTYAAAYAWTGDVGVSHTLSWTGGTPTATGSSVVYTMYAKSTNATAGHGWSLTIPASTTSRTLKIYAQTWAAATTLTCSLSDASASDYTSTALIETAGTDVVYGAWTIDFKSATAAQTMTVTLISTTLYNNDGNHGIAGATLQ
jgi:hypothetical protein